MKDALTDLRVHKIDFLHKNEKVVGVEGDARDARRIL